MDFDAARNYLDKLKHKAFPSAETWKDARPAFDALINEIAKNKHVVPYAGNTLTWFTNSCPYIEEYFIRFMELLGIRGVEYIFKAANNMNAGTKKRMLNQPGVVKSLVDSLSKLMVSVSFVGKLYHDEWIDNPLFTELIHNYLLTDADYFYYFIKYKDPIVDAEVKKSIIGTLLGHVANEEFWLVITAINHLKSNGFNWPELEVILTGMKAIKNG